MSERALTPYQIGVLVTEVMDAYHARDGERLVELGHALLAEGRRLQTGSGAARTVDAPDVEEQPASVEVDG